MNLKPKISIAVPFYSGMKNAEYFLKRCLESITKQTFKDYEIVVTEDGKMAENTNSAIKKSKGELIKILYMDDFFNDEHSLQDIVDHFSDEDNWLVTGCGHTEGGLHFPTYNDQIQIKNTIGSPSVLTIRNDNPLLFDESMTWMLDCDYYKRLYARYGEPKILNTLNVILGTGDHQTTNILSDEIKNNEHEYMLKKHG